METPFRLRGELRGHEDDVRQIAVAEEGSLILTSSYDGTVRAWRAGGAAHELQQECVLAGHKGFVAPLCVTPSPYCELISGGSDQLVRLWGNVSNLSGSMRISLSGHELQVTALTVLPSGDLLSASQDKTIRVWDAGCDTPACKAILSGGESSVLCLLALPDGGFLSGGADKLIRRWSASLEQTGTYTGHGDSVRSLALLEGVGFISASHDLTARLWTFDGQVLSEFKGHSALVYTARVLPSGSIVTASEDCTAKVWSTDGACLQTLTHPKCVWHAEPLPNNDIVTACGDNVARLWTQAEDRVDPTGVAQSNLDDALRKKQHDGETTPSDVPMEDSSVLQRPGKRDGETKVIRENDKGMAYTWNAAQGEWEKVGEVVGKQEGLNTANKTVDGVEYDYVFDVQLEQGGSYLKLPYNKGDNPYEVRRFTRLRFMVCVMIRIIHTAEFAHIFAQVADRWCEQHNLPADIYRNQIVQFLLQNTEQTGAAIGSVNNDPLTGGGYQPSPPSNNTANSNGQQRQLAFVPMNEAVVFKDGKIDTIRSKLREFSKAAGKPMPSLDAVADALKAASGNDASAANLPDGTNQLFDQLMAMPTEKLFPALDLARLLILDGKVAQHAASVFHALEDALVRASSEGSNANIVAGLRLLANSFQHSTIASAVRSKRAELVAPFLEKAERGSKAVRNGVATVLLNLAVECDRDAAEQVLLGSTQIARACEQVGGTEDETVARCLVAIGTAVKVNDASIKTFANDLGVLETAQKYTSSTDQKCSTASADVVQLLST